MKKFTKLCFCGLRNKELFETLLSGPKSRCHHNFLKTFLLHKNFSLKVIYQDTFEDEEILSYTQKSHNSRCNVF